MSLVERVYRLHRVQRIHWKRWQNRIIAECLCVCVSERSIVVLYPCQLIEKRLSASATFIFLFLYPFFIDVVREWSQDSFICKTIMRCLCSSAIEYYDYLFVNFSNLWCAPFNNSQISRLVFLSFFGGHNSESLMFGCHSAPQRKHFWHFFCSLINRLYDLYSAESRWKSLRN